LYAKIFNQIFDSSLAEDPTMRHMFMDMLVLADPTGQVDMTHEAIARRINVPIEVVRVNISKLCEPDTSSRTTKEDGRRLMPLSDDRDWGWQIVNFADYHAMKDENARRDYMRTYMRKRRAKEAREKAPVNTSKPELTHEDVNVNKDVDEDVKEKSAPPPADTGSLQQLCAYWKLTKSGDISPVWRIKVAEALRQGVTVAQAKAVFDRVRVDMAPWTLQTELLNEMDGGKGDGATASGKGDKRSPRRFASADKQARDHYPGGKFADR